MHFDAVAGAKGYDVWVSTHADGRGAVRLVADWPGPGQQLGGLRANTDYHLFVVYTDSQGKASKPSKAFAFRLKDMFPMR